MNNLEEVLIKEGILINYLKNFDFSFSTFESDTLASSFNWARTSEGNTFWFDIDAECSNLQILKSRVTELKCRYGLLPPRYKEIL